MTLTYYRFSIHNNLDLHAEAADMLTRPVYGYSGLDQLIFCSYTSAKCEQTPISLEVLQARWRLFGHVLRREPSIPANKAMAFYFHDNAKRARGRPITTLPMTLNNDLEIMQNRSISLTSQKDLETIRKIAKRRQEWTTFTADIKKAAEAARSDS